MSISAYSQERQIPQRSFYNSILVDNILKKNYYIGPGDVSFFFFLQIHYSCKCT